MFFAHSANSSGERQTLTDHLLQTADLSKSFAPRDELRELFYLCGLLHDLGKFQDGFQRYLEFGRPRTPHAGIGALIARKLFKATLPLPFVIHGHHAGLPDRDKLISSLQSLEDDREIAQMVEGRFRDNFPPISSNVLLPERYKAEKLLLECVSRLLFSSLTDADWLDTERHFVPENGNLRSTHKLQYDSLLLKLEQEFSGLEHDGVVNGLRTEARVEASGRFNESPGFFSLQLPTGLGKTLTSIYWALLHARKYELERIIIVLPYINIIDQTVSILQGVFGNDIVLEHHSGIIDDDADYATETIAERRVSVRQLSCENWQAPIIVTTAVQFFESLFSHKPFKCRKNHSIANAVVIFDEIQTLPKHLAEPTVVMLKNLASVARTSFLFCTATMPAFGKGEGFDGIDSISPLIRNPKRYFSAARRVEYKLLKNLKPLTLGEVGKSLLSVRESCLIVVNTKAIAKELFTLIKGQAKHDAYYHLSTAMCPHHRLRTIDQIKQDLDPTQSRKIAVVSTQLIEAGVDLDFPCVFRAIAPLDAIIQAAGRCNRNGRIKKGRVVLFDLVGHKMPDRTYRSCADFASGLIKDDPEALHNHATFELYYEQLIKFFVNPDKFGITAEREHFNFETVDQQYQIIEKGRTVALLILKYSAASEAAWTDAEKEFHRKGYIPQEQRSRLQQFTVQVYRDFTKRFASQISVHTSGVNIWYGGYSELFGLAPDDVETVF